jgi:hypothetical protein
VRDGVPKSRQLPISQLFAASCAIRPAVQDAQQEANMLRGYIDSGRMPEVDQAKKRRRPMTFADVGQECADSWKTRGQLKTLRRRPSITTC